MGPLHMLKLPFHSLRFREKHPCDYIFKSTLCFLFHGTFFLLPSPPFGLLLTWVSTRESDLYLLSCLSGGFASEGLWPLSQNRHDSEGWLYFLSPKSYTSKTFHQMLKECQHLESTLSLLRVARCYM